MAKDDIRLAPMSPEARAAFALAVDGMLEAPIFGDDESHQYLVEHPDEDGLLQTKSFGTKKAADAYCKKHPEAEYVGRRPLATLFIV